LPVFLLGGFQWSRPQCMSSRRPWPKSRSSFCRIGWRPRPANLSGRRALPPKGTARPERALQ
jgi:hypothetical protein